MPNKYLYKFRSMRDEHVGRIFTHNELYFASPALFNDPFDCKVSVSTKDCTDEAMWGKRWSFLKLFLLRKAMHWKYEGEYRAMIGPTEEQQIAYGYYHFPPEILTGVILGCQISDADKCSVEAWQKEYQPQLKIYRAVKDENSFSLKMEPPIEP